jgi:hypothetical protein
MQPLRLERRPELDALRGLFLAWMVLTHLPTHFSDFVNSPIGFVSSAEGFVFISALLVGRLYIRKLMEDASGVRHRLWKRSLEIYGYHLLMLALVFTVAAAFAVHSHKAAISNLLDFYLAHPFVAIVGSVLLLYCPPLLDILPMYVLFLFFTPLVLSAAVRFGWKKVLLASGCIWLLAQFGLRDLVHNWVVHFTHLQIPIQEAGAFNLFAWQALWVVALWMGARSATRHETFSDPPRWMAVLSCAACLFFVGIRWGWLGPHLTWPALDLQLDKWRLGPLRVLNMVAFTVVVYWLRRHLVKFVAVEPFLTLGKASLRVFCTHLVFVFVGLALLVRDVGEDVGAPLEQLHGLTAILLIAVTFTVLILVASQRARKRRKRQGGTQDQKAAESAATPASPPQLEAEISSRAFAEEAGHAAALCSGEPLPAVENSR